MSSNNQNEVAEEAASVDLVSIPIIQNLSTYNVNDVVEVSRRMQAGQNCQGGKARITKVYYIDDEYRYDVAYIVANSKKKETKIKAQFLKFAEEESLINRRADKGRCSNCAAFIKHCGGNCPKRDDADNIFRNPSQEDIQNNYIDYSESKILIKGLNIGEEYHHISDKIHCSIRTKSIDLYSERLRKKRSDNNMVDFNQISNLDGIGNLFDEESLFIEKIDIISQFTSRELILALLHLCEKLVEKLIFQIEAKITSTSQQIEDVLKEIDIDNIDMIDNYRKEEMVFIKKWNFRLHRSCCKVAFCCLDQLQKLNEAQNKVTSDNVKIVLYYSHYFEKLRPKRLFYCSKYRRLINRIYLHLFKMLGSQNQDDDSHSESVDDGSDDSYGDCSDSSFSDTDDEPYVEENLNNKRSRSDKTVVTSQDSRDVINVKNKKLISGDGRSFPSINYLSNNVSIPKYESRIMEHLQSSSPQQAETSVINLVDEEEQDEKQQQQQRECKKQITEKRKSDKISIAEYEDIESLGIGHIRASIRKYLQQVEEIKSVDSLLDMLGLCSKSFENILKNASNYFETRARELRLKKLQTIAEVATIEELYEWWLSILSFIDNDVTNLYYQCISKLNNLKSKMTEQERKRMNRYRREIDVQKGLRTDTAFLILKLKEKVKNELLCSTTDLLDGDTYLNDENDEFDDSRGSSDDSVIFAKTHSGKKNMKSDKISSKKMVVDIPPIEVNRVSHNTNDNYISNQNQTRKRKVDDFSNLRTNLTATQFAAREIFCNIALSGDLLAENLTSDLKDTKLSAIDNINEVIKYLNSTPFFELKLSKIKRITSADLLLEITSLCDISGREVLDDANKIYKSSIAKAQNKREVDRIVERWIESLTFIDRAILRLGNDCVNTAKQFQSNLSSDQIRTLKQLMSSLDVISSDRESSATSNRKKKEELRNEFGSGTFDMNAESTQLDNTTIENLQYPHKKLLKTIRKEIRSYKIFTDFKRKNSNAKDKVHIKSTSSSKEEFEDFINNDIIDPIELSTGIITSEQLFNGKENTNPSNNNYYKAMKIRNIGMINSAVDAFLSAFEFSLVNTEKFAIKRYNSDQFNKCIESKLEPIDISSSINELINEIFNQPGLSTSLKWNQIGIEIKRIKLNSIFLPGGQINESVWQKLAICFDIINSTIDFASESIYTDQSRVTCILSYYSDIEKILDGIKNKGNDLRSKKLFDWSWLILRKEELKCIQIMLEKLKIKLEIQSNFKDQYVSAYHNIVLNLFRRLQKILKSFLQYLSYNQKEDNILFQTLNILNGKIDLSDYENPLSKSHISNLDQQSTIKLLLRNIYCCVHSIRYTQSSITKFSFENQAFQNEIDNFYFLKFMYEETTISQSLRKEKASLLSVSEFSNQISAHLIPTTLVDFTNNSCISDDCELWGFVSLFSYFLFTVNIKLEPKAIRIREDWELVDNLITATLNKLLKKNSNISNDNKARGIEKLISRIVNISFLFQFKSENKLFSPLISFVNVLRKFSLSTSLINDVIIIKDQYSDSSANIKLLKLSCATYQEYITSKEYDGGFLIILDILFEKMRIKNPAKNSTKCMIHFIVESLSKLISNLQLKYSSSPEFREATGLSIKKVNGSIDKIIFPSLLAIYKGNSSLLVGIIICTLTQMISAIIDEPVALKKKLEEEFTNNPNKDDNVLLMWTLSLTFPPKIDRRNDIDFNSKYIVEMSSIGRAMKTTDAFSISTCCILLKTLVSTNPLSVIATQNFLIAFPHELLKWSIIVINHTLRKFSEDKVSAIAATYVFNLSVQYLYKWKSLYDRLQTSDRTADITLKSNLEFKAIFDTIKRVPTETFRTVFRILTISSFDQDKGRFEELIVSDWRNYVEKNTPLFCYDLLRSFSLITLIESHNNPLCPVVIDNIKMIESTRVIDKDSGYYPVTSAWYHCIYLSNIMGINNGVDKNVIVSYDKILTLVIIRVLLVDTIRPTFFSRNQIKSFIFGIKQLVNYFSVLSKEEKEQLDFNRYIDNCFRVVDVSEEDSLINLNSFLNSLIKYYKIYYNNITKNPINIDSGFKELVSDIVKEFRDLNYPEQPNTRRLFKYLPQFLMNYYSNSFDKHCPQYVKSTYEIFSKTLKEVLKYSPELFFDILPFYIPLLSFTEDWKSLLSDKSIFLEDSNKFKVSWLISLCIDHVMMSSLNEDICIDSLVISHRIVKDISPLIENCKKNGLVFSHYSGELKTFIRSTSSEINHHLDKLETILNSFLL